MRGALIALSLGAGLGLLSACSNTAEAESKTAWCALFREGDNSAELPEPVPCQFSQKQGDVTISIDGQRYDFAASEQGKTYQRDNHSLGIGFSRQDDFTLVVFWDDPRQQGLRLCQDMLKLCWALQIINSKLTNIWLIKPGR